MDRADRRGALWRVRGWFDRFGFVCVDCSCENCRMSARRHKGEVVERFDFAHGGGDGGEVFVGTPFALWVKGGHRRREAVIGRWLCAGVSPLVVDM